jgi:dihydroneopterin aldolase
MYWTLQNLKDSEDNQDILHYGSMFSAATVHYNERHLNTWHAHC